MRKHNVFNKFCFYTENYPSNQIYNNEIFYFDQHGLQSQLVYRIRLSVSDKFFLSFLFIFIKHTHFQQINLFEGTFIYVIFARIYAKKIW